MNTSAPESAAPKSTCPSLPVTIVLTVLNEAASILETLGALLDQMEEEDELVVVDGGSVDGTVERMETLSTRDDRFRLHVAAGVGISQGRNIAISLATREVIVCTDAGCRPSNDWLYGLRETFRRQSPALVTGAYRVEAKTLFQRALKHAGYPAVEEMRLRRPWISAYTKVFGTGWSPGLPTGRSMAFARKSWAAVGGFDENLPYAEDTRFGQALAGLGPAVFAEVGEVAWEQRGTAWSNTLMFYRYGVGDGLGEMDYSARRNAARVAFYAALTLGLLSRRSRLWSGVAFAAQWSLPVRRALSAGDASAVPLIPVAILSKDLGKIAGWLCGLVGRHRKRASVTPRKLGP